ncbi:hypothetical protein [Lactococcus lactis]|uniref:hypothetical protein n=1 Tax=Lactococcus lactis TaxID=1358 RepID=UPI0022E6D3B1|nr:hypothetical protein [Lactococcus lactis]
MEKDFYYPMTPNLLKLAQKPVRTKFDVLNILFETITTLLSLDFEDRCPNNEPYFRLYISKMNRLFFRLNDEKYFSIAFPFHVSIEEGKKILLDCSGIRIDSESKYDLKILFDNLRNNIDPTDAIIDVLADAEKSELGFDWKILQNLLIYEAGYIRYDKDIEHENGNLHPLEHLDINYESNATYKIGVPNRKITMEKLHDLLNIETEQNFLNL